LSPEAIHTAEFVHKIDNLSDSLNSSNIQVSNYKAFKSAIHLSGDEFCDRYALAKQSYHLPKLLWGEACNTAVYLLNLTGPSHDESKTPLEIWTGETFRDLKHWDAKSIPGILVGYHGFRDGYRVYVPSERRTCRAHDVEFKLERTLTVKIKKTIMHILKFMTKGA
ncbi:hypothetical protein ILUMI_26218, partial [Ignelater luminosus]